MYKYFIVEELNNIIKKLVSILFIIILLLSTAIPSFAVDDNSNTSIIHLDNGSYLLIEVSEIHISRATNTKTGTKSITYKNDDNEAMCW